MTTVSFEMVSHIAKRRGYTLKEVKGCYALYPEVHGTQEADEMPYFSKSLLGMKLWLEKQPAKGEIRPKTARSLREKKKGRA